MINYFLNCLNDHFQETTSLFLTRWTLNDFIKRREREREKSKRGEPNW